MNGICIVINIVSKVLCFSLFTVCLYHLTVNTQLWVWSSLVLVLVVYSHPCCALLLTKNKNK